MKTRLILALSAFVLLLGFGFRTSHSQADPEQKSSLWQEPQGEAAEPGVQSGQTQSGQVQSVWRTVRDGKCTIAVPGDWIVDEDMPDPTKVHRSGTGPATEASIMELPVGPDKPTFISLKDHLLKDALRAKATHLQMYHHTEDVRVLENSPTRFVLMTASPDTGDGPGDADWIFLAAGDPICKGRVYAGGAFANAGSEMRAAAQQLRAVAEKIVTTFAPPK